jgi:site-specific DNA recombinase
VSIIAFPITIGELRRQLVTYARTSSDTLLGLHGQEDELRDYAAANAITLTEAFRDNNVSGLLRADKRKGLAAALTAAQQPGIAGIIVSHLDRIGRDVNTMLDAAHRIWETDRDLYTIEDGQIPRGLEGLALLTIAGKLAEYERRTIVKRLQAGRSRKAARGGFPGGRQDRRRYGVELVTINGKLEYRPIPAAQAVIRRICQDRAAGATYERIARALNAEGIPTVTGVPWSKAVVRDLALRGPDKLTAIEGTTTVVLPSVGWGLSPVGLSSVDAEKEAQGASQGEGEGAGAGSGYGSVHRAREARGA